MIKRLSELKIGDVATVFGTNCTAWLSARLYSLGLCAKDRLIVEAKSLCGKTIKIAIVNPASKIRIAIRDTEAALILVHLETPEQDVEQ